MDEKFNDEIPKEGSKSMHLAQFKSSVDGWYSSHKRLFFYEEPIFMIEVGRMQCEIFLLRAHVEKTVTDFTRHG